MPCCVLPSRVASALASNLSGQREINSKGCRPSPGSVLNEQNHCYTESIECSRPWSQDPLDLMLRDTTDSWIQSRDMSPHQTWAGLILGEQKLLAAADVAQTEVSQTAPRHLRDSSFLGWSLGENSGL